MSEVFYQLNYKPIKKIRLRKKSYLFRLFFYTKKKDEKDLNNIYLNSDI